MGVIHLICLLDSLGTGRDFAPEKTPEFIDPPGGKLGGTDDTQSAGAQGGFYYTVFEVFCFVSG